VNELRRQGLEVHTAAGAFSIGNVSVGAGDWIVRADQPYRTLAEMYFSLQNFSPDNPRPYDDTGWTFPLMRNVVITPITEKSILDQRMAMVTSEVRARGGVTGSGNVIVVDHTTDNNLVTFRYRFPNVRMQAAEQDFEASGHRFRAGAFIIPGANRAQIEPALTELGLSGFAMSSAPNVPSHEMDLPRIGYVHAWQRTQDEGWVRAAFDTYGIPYDYFADKKLREGNLREKYDVIVYPHVGGDAQSMVNGIAMTGTMPLPYRKTDETPNLGVQDESDDIRGGMGIEGLMALYEFVKAGGTLLVEGATSTIFPEYNLTSGVSVEEPEDLFVRGSILRGIIADPASPIAYGYAGTQLPVYFNSAPVLNAGGAGGFGFGGRGAGPGQNTTPMASRLQLSQWDSTTSTGQARSNQGGQGGQGGFGGRGGFGGGDPSERPRVILRFPDDADDMLLSGTLLNGESLENRAQVVDVPLGEGHVVMFGIRPFWRWQTQGTFFLGFNTLLNWNDLGAGRAVATDRATSGN
jgi:hypothetical protein